MRKNGLEELEQEVPTHLIKLAIFTNASCTTKDSSSRDG